MENILVAGANGTTGRKIVNLLKQSQYFNPVAMVRKEEQLEKFKSQGIATVLGDLEEDISHAFKNVDKVLFAAGSGGKKVVAVDQDGAKKMINESKKANIKKFVMLSSIGADNPDASDDLKDYLRAKHNADEYLKNSNLNYTIVRPGSLTNEEEKGTIALKNHFTEHGQITRADVAQTLVRCLHDNSVNKKTFEILEGETLIGKALEDISS